MTECPFLSESLQAIGRFVPQTYGPKLWELWVVLITRTRRLWKFRQQHHFAHLRVALHEIVSVVRTRRRTTSSAS